MKIRTDFVTNSSSSSFVLFGVASDAIKLSDSDKAERNDIGEEEFWQNKTDDSIICFGSGEYNSYVGVTIGTIFGAKEFADLKVSEVLKKVAEELNKICGTSFVEKDIEYVEEVTYN